MASRGRERRLPIRHERAEDMGSSTKTLYQSEGGATARAFSRHGAGGRMRPTGRGWLRSKGPQENGTGALEKG